MVSFQLESDAEVRSPRFTCGIKVARAMDRADSSLVSLLFGNHFVVELLVATSREESARHCCGGILKILNLLSTYLITKSDAEAVISVPFME